MESRYLRKSRITQRNSFVHGIALSFNIFGSSSKILSKITQVSDIEALRDDWNTVGNDIREAISQFEEKYEKEFVKK